MACSKCSCSYLSSCSCCVCRQLCSPCTCTCCTCSYVGLHVCSAAALHLQLHPMFQLAMHVCCALCLLWLHACQALGHLSEDAAFLSTLHSWLDELVPERSDANLHVLLKLLELLGKLSSSWPALSGSSLLDSIKAASEHRSREVAQAAAAIRKVGSGVRALAGGWLAMPYEVKHC